MDKKPIKIEKEEQDCDEPLSDDEETTRTPLKKKKYRHIVVEESDDEGQGGGGVGQERLGGTFPESQDDDEDDLWMSQVADILDTTIPHGDDNSNDDNDHDHHFKFGSSSSEQDDYDLDDEFIDNDDVDDEEESTSSSSGAGDEEFSPPDPYLARLLTPTKTSFGKCRKRRRERNNKCSGVKRRKLQKRKNDADTEDEDDQDDDDFVEIDPDVQEVSIHKLNLHHNNFKSIIKGSLNPEEAIIKNIIEGQNKRKGPKYVEKVVAKYPTMVQEDADFLTSQNHDVEPFKIKIFAQVNPRRLALMTAYGVNDVTSQFCHTLIFHYRTNEVFVLTTSQAWNVVQWCSDFSFPGKVAARILSRKGALEVTTMALIGTDFMSKKSHKQIQESNPFNLLQFCKSYTTLIEENASILKLDCFSSQRPDVGDDDMSDAQDFPRTTASKKTTPRKKNRSKSMATSRVQVTQAAVRIVKRFKPTDFLAILHHLSHIARKKPTQTLDGKVEQDTSAHIQYLQPVHFEVAKSLDLELSKQIHSSISDDGQMPLMHNYDFAHKHFEDFFYGHDFFLKHGRNNIKNWKSLPPTCQQVVKALRGVDKLTDIGPNMTDEVFQKELDKCKIVYKTNHGNTTDRVVQGEKVLNFIQGMLYRPYDNNVYWHIQGIWCYLQPSYILLIQKELKAILDENLQVSTRIGLKFAWSCSSLADEAAETEQDEQDPDPHQATKSYLEQYEHLPDYFVSTEPGEDILDMIKIRNSGDGFTIFYILQSLSHSSLTKGIHITKALTSIQKAVMVDAGSTSRPTRKNQGVGGSEHNVEDLQKLYEQLKTKPSFNNVTPTFFDFQKLMRDAVVVLGIGQDTATTTARTLEQENEIPTSIDVDDIENRLICAERSKVEQVAAKLGLEIHVTGNYRSLALVIHQLMEDNDLITASDNTITLKLVALSPIAVPIAQLKEYSTWVYETFVQPFQPQAATFIGKLELIRIYRHAKKLGIRRFYIGEIPLEDD